MLVIPRVKLSRKRHIPIFYIAGTPAAFLDHEWYPHQIMGLISKLIESTHWKRIDSKYFEYKPFHMKLHLNYLGMMDEWHRIWDKYYSLLPVRDKVVLDVGAGCGETACFFLKRSARKIICVEPNPAAVACLRENVSRNNWNVQILEEPFSLEMLNTLQFDCMKMDCEGCESALLDYDKPLPPSIIELHSNELLTQFKAKFLARYLANVNENTSVSLVAIAINPL